MAYDSSQVRRFPKPYPRVALAADPTLQGELRAEGPEQSEVYWPGASSADYVPNKKLVRLNGGEAAPSRTRPSVNDELNLQAQLQAQGKQMLEAQQFTKPVRCSPPDDLVDRLKPFGLPELKNFAKLNGAWDDKYDALPNPGLVRMNVVNRLRAKVKKGYVVRWK